MRHIVTIFMLFYISDGFMYKEPMEQKPLSQTNVYLHDPEKRRKALLRSVLSSSAVEGINLTAQELTQLQRTPAIPIPRSGSAR